MGPVLKYSWRVVLAAMLLTAASLVSYEGPYHFAELPSRPATRETLQALLGWLFTSKLLITICLTYLTVRSRWSGMQLMCAIFVTYFGVFTFISQTHAAMTRGAAFMPQTAAILTAHGFLVALLFSFALVVLMGKAWAPGLLTESARLHLPPLEWLWKAALCAAAWVALDLLVGEKGGVLLLWQRMTMQAIRALLMIVFVLPAIKMLQGGRLETALAIGSTLAVLGAISPVIRWRLMLGDAVQVWPTVALIGMTWAYGLLVGYLFGRQLPQPWGAGFANPTRRA